MRRRVGALVEPGYHVGDRRTTAAGSDVIDGRDVADAICRYRRRQAVFVKLSFAVDVVGDQLEKSDFRSAGSQ